MSRATRDSLVLLAVSTALLLGAAVAVAAPMSPVGGRAAAASGDARAESTDGGHTDDAEEGPRLSDEAKPLGVGGVPERPRPPIELGNPFLGSRRLHPGFELPTGAVWQPSLFAFGTVRTALASWDDGQQEATELAVRLDLFFNLQLSGTERLVVGFRPLDEGGRFTRYQIDPDPADGDRFEDHFDADLSSLFFEGDFGEIFPNLDRPDFRRYDVGFAVGRQPLSFQGGMLIDDTIDALGITRNTLQPNGTSNFRITGLYGWNELDRENRETRSDLFALLTSTDLRRSTIDADLAWVRSADGEADLVAAGFTFVQRFGKVATTFRLLGSWAPDGESVTAADGALLFGEASWVPPHSEDHLYVSGFLAVDRFTGAARGPDRGGPLGAAGINFAAVGLGTVPPALSSRAEDVVGGAIGYQRFFDLTRKQLIVELAGRVGIDDLIADEVGATLRYQAAFRQHGVLVADVFWAYRSGGLAVDGDRWGLRLELLGKF